jgi:hypothetical protein
MFAGIEEAISRLNRLAIAIRQSSRSVATTRARRYAAENRYLSEFEEAARSALESLYPNASESLRSHLCNTMTDRYAKLEFQRHKYGKAEERPPDQVSETKSSLETLRREEETPSKATAPQGPSHMQFTPSRKPPAHRLPLPTLDRSLLHENLGLKRPMTKQPASRAVSVFRADEILHEPPTPVFEAGETKSDCEWCRRGLFLSDLSKPGRWSDRGKWVPRFLLSIWK